MDRVLRVTFALAAITIVLLASMAPIAQAGYVWGQSVPLMTAHLTEASKKCVACHNYATHFIVDDWKKSRHYLVGVGCAECHLAPADRPDALEHYGFKIVTVVTPKQCARCHPAIVEEYEKSVHAYAGMHCYLLPEYPMFWVSVAEKPLAWPEVIPVEYIKTWPAENLKKFAPDVYELQMKVYEGEPGIKAFTEDPTVAILGGVEPQGLSIEKAETKKLIILWGLYGCMACHGANFNEKFRAEIVKRTGKFAGIVTTGAGGGFEYYDPAVVTNHGAGRINPDGSLGSCETCHPFHSFSVKIARKAWEACGRCHYGHDHPNDEQWKASLHGAIVLGEYADYAWDKRSNDWKPGRDFRAPTCAACHMGAVWDKSMSRLLYPASHDVAAICKWKLGKWMISMLRLAGQRDPSTPAWVCELWEKWYGMKITYPEPDWKARRERCIAMCSQCHEKYFVASYLRTVDWGFLLVDYARDEFVLKVAGMLKAKGLFTPFDKIIVRHLGAMANRPSKMGFVHFAPDYRWWAGLVHYVQWIVEWLESVIERPAVKKKAPEIVEEIEKILPWWKEQVEAESFKVESAESLLPPKLVDLASKAESTKLVFAPLVKAVDVVEVGPVYTFSVAVKAPAETGVSPVALAALLVVPAALAEGRREE